jgi:hypothetical protein
MPDRRRILRRNDSGVKGGRDPFARSQARTSGMTKRKDTPMAYVISHFFPAGTREQYEAVMAALNGKLGVIPKGQLLHVAGPVPGGWQVIAVQESKETWDVFMAERFAPRMREGIAGGFTAPPQGLEFATTHVFQRE